MASTRFSIIIPTKQRPRDVELLFEDLQKQTETFEVILFNDGADADTRQVAQKEWNFSLTYLESEVSLNSAKSRNACLDKATGDWLVFLDDDVRVDASFLNNVREASYRYDIFSCQVLTPNASRKFKPFTVLLERVAFGRYFPWGIFVGGFHRARRKPTRVTHLPGAMMVYRASLVGDIRLDPWIGEGTGYLDDADFSVHVMRSSGASAWYVPSFSLDHLQTPSGGNRAHDPVRWYYYYQLHKVYFFQKYHPRMKLVVALVTGVECLLRCIATRRFLIPSYVKATREAWNQA